MFLLQQGTHGRGIIASGHFASEVRQRAHWDGRGGTANYADVYWDVWLYPEERLPIERLFAELPGGHWEPRGSGVSVRPDVAAGLELLWAEHVGVIVSPPSPESGKPAMSAKPRGGGQGRQMDVAVRKAVEDYAQDLVMKQWRAEGWRVDDLRRGNPFDAKATKDSETRYLEVKGTTTDGGRVLVTRGEVEWARSHPGECVISVVWDIGVCDDGTIEAETGWVWEYEWDPDDEQLEPVTYDYYPDRNQLIDIYAVPPL